MHRGRVGLCSEDGQLVSDTRVKAEMIGPEPGAG